MRVFPFPLIGVSKSAKFTTFTFFRVKRVSFGRPTLIFKWSWIVPTLGCCPFRGRLLLCQWSSLLYRNSFPISLIVIGLLYSTSIPILRLTSPPLPSTLISLSPPLLPSPPLLESRMGSLSLHSQLDLGVNLPSLHYSLTALPLPPHLATPPLPSLSIKKRHSSMSRKERKVRSYQACKPSKEGNHH